MWIQIVCFCCSTNAFLKQVFNSEHQHASFIDLMPLKIEMKNEGVEEFDIMEHELTGAGEGEFARLRE